MPDLTRQRMKKKLLLFIFICFSFCVPAQNLQFETVYDFSFPVKKANFALAKIDLKNDGKQDLVVSKLDSICIYLNDGTGHFSLFQNIPMNASNISRVKVADFNKDGFSDVAIIVYPLDTLKYTMQIYASDASGLLTKYYQGNFSNVSATRVVDFNEDGLPDLLSAGIDTLYSLYNTGTGFLVKRKYFKNLDGREVAYGMGKWNYKKSIYASLSIPNGGVAEFTLDSLNELSYEGSGASTDFQRREFFDIDLDGYDEVIRWSKKELEVSSPTMHLILPLINTGEPYFITIQDMNGDSFPEIVTSSGDLDDYNHKVTVYTSDGKTITLADTIQVLAYPNDVAIGDFNADGNQDMAVICRPIVDPQVSIIPGLGGLKFERIMKSYRSAYGRCSAIFNMADMNNDGKEDMIVGDCDNHINYVVGLNLREDSPLQFKKGTIAVSDPEVKSVNTFDFNNDKNKDMLISDGPGTGSAVYLGTGTGEFYKNFPSGAGNEICVDINRDGFDDVVQHVHDGVVVSLSNGVDAFNRTYETHDITCAGSIAVGDMDDDGFEDILVPTCIGGGNYGGLLQILFGKGDGTFIKGPIYKLPTDHQGQKCYVLDYDKDGYRDVLVLSYYYGMFDRYYTYDLYKGNGTKELEFIRYNYLEGGNSDPIFQVADLDKDGYMEIIETSHSNATYMLQIFPGNLEWDHKKAVKYHVPFGGVFYIEDVNDDKKPDIIISNAERFYFLLNKSTEINCTAKDCNADSVTLTAGVGFHYIWSNGATTAQIKVPNNGSYSVTVSNYVGSEKRTASIQLPLEQQMIAPIITQKGNWLKVVTISTQYTYQWYKDGSIIPGETNSELNLRKRGDYYVEITNITNCKKSSNHIVITVSPNHIEEENNSIRLSYYPNPFFNSVTIDLEVDQLYDKTISMNIYSVEGKLLSNRIFNIHTGKNHIALGEDSWIGLSPGVYILKIQGQSLNKVVKLNKVQ
jgi:hypothetical protein